MDVMVCRSSWSNVMLEELRVPVMVAVILVVVVVVVVAVVGGKRATQEGRMSEILNGEAKEVEG